MYTSYFHTTPEHYQERFGLAFEHLEAGMRFAHRPGVTVTQQDNTEEALDSVNAAMIHYDEAYAGHTSWKKPLMVSTITLQRLVGMTSRTFGLNRKRIVRFSEIALKRPMFGGDTLYAESEIVDVADAGPGLGRVTLRTLGINQSGETVAVLDYAFEMWRSGMRPGSQRENVAPALEPRFASHMARADGAWVEQTGLFYEDLREGETFAHYPGRSFRADESITHALRSLEISPQFHNLQFAEDAGLPALAIPQTWVLTVAAALSTRTFGRVTANLAWRDVEFGEEVLPGDTMHAQSTILEMRSSSSRPSEGIARVRTEARNQRGQEILRYERSLLVYKRAGQNPYEAAGY